MAQPANPESQDPQGVSGGFNPHTPVVSGSARPAAMSFILLTLFIDILGIGVVIPVIPALVKEFIGESTAVASKLDNAATADAIAGDEDSSQTASAAEQIHSRIHSQAGWYVGIISCTYALTQFLFAPVVGALSDRFGRRPIILGSLFGFGVDFIIQGLAPSITWLFVGRFIAGIMGASFSTANAYIADVSTDENRARNFGLVGMMFGLGFICGPALGGLLGEIWVRLPFFVSAGLALVNWLYGYFVLPESLPADQRSSLTLAKMNPLGTIGRLQAYPIVLGLALPFVCMALAQRGLENVWVLYTEYRFEWSKLANGLTLGLVGVMAAFVQGGLVRPTIKRFGERKTVIVGILVSAIAFLGYGLAWQGWMIPCIIVFGAFGGVAGPAIQSIVAGSVEPSEQGKIQGAMTSLNSLTSVIAPILFTTGLFSYFISDKAPFELPGVTFLVGGLLWIIALVVVIRVFRRIPTAVAAPSGAATRMDAIDDRIASGAQADHQPPV